MFKVYILYSSEYNKIYIGYSSDVETRFRAHNEFATKGWTIKFRPWKLIYTEEYTTKHEALLREKQSKSAAGREWIWSELVAKL
jgi:putative endonuclease